MNQEIVNLYIREYTRRDKTKKVVWLVGISLVAILFVPVTLYALVDWIDGVVDHVEPWTMIPMFFIYGMILLGTWLVTLIATISNNKAINDLQTAYPDPQGVAWSTYKTIRGSNSPTVSENTTTDAVEAARERVAARNS